MSCWVIVHNAGMKAAAVLGMVLALFFASLSVIAFNDLQDTGEAISGLEAPTVRFFQVVPTIATVMVAFIAVVALAGIVVFMVKNL